MISAKAKKMLDHDLKKHNLFPVNYDSLLKLYSASVDEHQFDIQSIRKNIVVPWATLGIEDDLVSRYKKVNQLGVGVRLEKLVLIYGDTEGKARWDSYKEKHRHKNTLKGKQEKYGWTEEQFEKFNKSRAITLENLTKKYGDIEGATRWDEYRNKQKVNGCTFEYFVSKYGEIVGSEIYNEVCRLKSHSLETYQDKFGKEEGTKKFNNYITSSRHSFISIASKEFFSLLDDRMKLENSLYSSVSVYFAPKTKEFCKYDSICSRVYFYDYALPRANLIVEYNGDLYHANPKVYKDTDVPKFRGNTLTAKELWERDDNKKKVANDAGFDVLYVWDSDVKENKEQELERIICEIQRRL